MSQKYFRSPEELHIFSEAIPYIIAALNSGRVGDFGTCSVHSSKKGYRIALSGKTLAKGKNPKELAAAFEASVEKAKRA